jgi:hypothetical protein
VDKNLDRAPGEPIFRVGIVFGTALFSVHLPGPEMTIDVTPGPPVGLRSPYPPHDVRWWRTSIDGGRDFVGRGRIDTIDLFVPSLAALPAPSHDEIATRAYFRWLTREGSAKAGTALDDWLEAEQELLWASRPSTELT